MPTKKIVANNNAASLLILYHMSPGGSHLTSSLRLVWDSFRFAVWNLFSMYRAFCRIAKLGSLPLPSLTSLRLNHKHQATITTSSSKSSPILCLNSKCHKKFTNSGKLIPHTSKGIPQSFQISRAFSQSHCTCSLLSAPKSHALQVGLSITF